MAMYNSIRGNKNTRGNKGVMTHARILAGMLLLSLYIGCSGSNSPTSASPTSAASSAPASTTQTVNVVPVVSQVLNKTIALPGELQAYESVAIFPKVSGFLEWIGVDRGSHVRKGQVIARLSAPELVSQRTEAQAKVQNADAQLTEAEAKLAADQSTWERLKNASATPGVVAGNDLVVAAKAVDADRARVQAQQQGAEAARAALRAVAEMEGYLRITAPFDGVVIERDDHPGALVGPNSATPIVRIEHIARLRLVIPVGESDVAGISLHQPITFVVSAFPGQKFVGRVARIAHDVDEKTRTMPVELDVVNTASRLAPGMFAEVTWPVRRPYPTLFVPTSAVARTQERTFVVRVRDGKTEWVDVKTGQVAGDRVEVFGDLRAGDQVAVRGTDELRPGTSVNARPSTEG